MSWTFIVRVDILWYLSFMSNKPFLDSLWFFWNIDIRYLSWRIFEQSSVYEVTNAVGRTTTLDTLQHHLDQSDLIVYHLDQSDLIEYDTQVRNNQLQRRIFLITTSNHIIHGVISSRPSSSWNDQILENVINRIKYVHIFHVDVLFIIFDATSLSNSSTNANIGRRWTVPLHVLYKLAIRFITNLFRPSRKYEIQFIH